MGVGVAVVIAVLGAAVGCGGPRFGSPSVMEPIEPGFQRGVALGFVDGSEASVARGGALASTLDEVRVLGASHVSILVPLYTESVNGRDVRRGLLDDARGGDGTIEGGAPTSAAGQEPARAEESDAQLRRVIAAARADGYEVMVFPLVRLRVRLPGQWRGTLAPEDRDAWFAAYTRELLAIADACEAAGAARLAIGSELVSFEDEPERWRALARAVRGRFHGRLLYSANWDRYDRVAFWDAVDEAGISAYFTLAARGVTDSDVLALTRAWRPIVERLAAFSARVQRPLVFTEVGFPSVSGAAFWPWNDHQSKTGCAAGEGCEGATSPETQRRLWAAFVSVFGERARTRFVVGVYAWLWSGAGGLRDRGYCPRGKPAESVIRLWYAHDRMLPSLGRR